MELTLGSGMVESVSGKVASGSEIKSGLEKEQMELRSLSECCSHRPWGRGMWPQIGQEQGRWRGGSRLPESFKRPNHQDLVIN